jgi:hypothetical protein
MPPGRSGRENPSVPPRETYPDRIVGTGYASLPILLLNIFSGIPRFYQGQAPILSRAGPDIIGEYL